MEQPELIPHLFRTEYRKITAVLCRQLGIEHIETAEDIASETFLAAVETWTYQGLPPNPQAWLYTVAKNKARNHFRRLALFRDKIAPELRTDEEQQAETDIDLSEQNITDSQLQMLFAICHPALSTETQIAMALRILCGFGIEEIADAFLAGKETISKRLTRGKDKLRQLQPAIAFPGKAEITRRLEAVLLTLYLLFNEGYYSESKDAVVRKDLCLEAMRLAHLLKANEQTNTPEVNALLALMCFHASRLEARQNDAGETILYQDQDESLWNRELIDKGIWFLNCAAKGREISRYHLEASIAFWHTIKTDSAEKWEHILQLYNYLLTIAYSPVAALNRTYALSKVHGSALAIKEAEALQLKDNHFYYALLGELYSETDKRQAQSHFQQALSLANTATDKQTIQKKIDALA